MVMSPAKYSVDCRMKYQFATYRNAALNDSSAASALDGLTAANTSAVTIRVRKAPGSNRRYRRA